MKAHIAFLVAAVACLFAQPALAATPGVIDGIVSFNYGAFVADVLREQAGPLALALVSGIMSFMPGGIATMIRMTRVDQLLEKAVVAGINKTAGAVQGKALSAHVGNEVIEKALEYAAFHAPALFKKLPINEWRDKIMARLSLDENVTIDPLLSGFVAVNRA